MHMGRTSAGDSPERPMSRITSRLDDGLVRDRGRDGNQRAGGGADHLGGGHVKRGRSSYVAFHDGLCGDESMRRTTVGFRTAVSIHTDHDR